MTTPLFEQPEAKQIHDLFESALNGCIAFAVLEIRTARDRAEKAEAATNAAQAEIAHLQTTVTTLRRELSAAQRQQTAAV